MLADEPLPPTIYYVADGHRLIPLFTADQLRAAHNQELAAENRRLRAALDDALRRVEIATSIPETR